METFLVLIIVVGLLIYFAFLFGSTGLRDLRKKDLVHINSIDDDRLSKYLYLTIIVRDYQGQPMEGLQVN